MAFSLETINKRDSVRRARVSARSFEDRHGMFRNRPLLSVAAIALLLACLWSPAGVAVNPAEEQTVTPRPIIFSPRRITLRRFAFIGKSCASIRRMRSLIITWVLLRGWRRQDAGAE